MEMSRLSKINYFLICVCVIVTTLIYGTVHQPVIALFYLAVALMVILWASDCLLSGTMRISRERLQVPLYAAAVYGFIQVIPFGSIIETAGVSDIPRTISVEPFSTQTTAIHYLALCFFFSVVLVYLDSAARLRKVVSVVTIFGFAFAFFAILQSVLSPNKIYGIYEVTFAQPFGSFVSRHNFAAYMEMAVSLPLGMMFVGAVRRDKKLLYTTAIILMGAALLLSGSRGGLVSLLAEIILLIILTTGRKGPKTLILKAGLAAALFAAVIGGAIFVGGDTSLTRVAETAVSQDVTTDRMHIWAVTVKVIAANLPFGAGFGAFAQGYTPFDTYSGLARVEQAHNDYLQVLADAGVVGLGIGLLFLYWFFRTGLLNASCSNVFRRGIATGAFAGCCAILVHSMFDFVLHTTAISILFLTLLAMMSSSGGEYADDIAEFDDEHSRHRRATRTRKDRDKTKHLP